MNGRHDQPKPANKPELDQPRTDEAIGARIRDLAAGWQPPVGAQGAQSWGDRVRRTDGRRQGWHGFGRILTAAAAMAVALTIVGAAFVVWLGLPRQGAPASGLTASPGSTASPRSRPTVDPATLYSPPPTITPGPTLPAYALSGPPLSPEQVIVEAGSGPAFFNIGTGRLTSLAVPTNPGFDQLFALPQGGYLCACVGTVGGLDPVTGRAQTTVTVTLRWLDAGGQPSHSLSLPSYVGRADPAVPIEGDHAAVTASLSPDGTTLYLGWAVEDPPVWRAAIDVVDLATGRILQSLGLPDLPDAVASTSASVGGAGVTFAPNDRVALIERLIWYAGTSARGSWHGTVPVRANRLGAVSALTPGVKWLDDGTCPGESGQVGFINATTLFEICDGPGGSILRRADLSGQPLGDTALGATTGGEAGLGIALDRAHGRLFAWDPFNGRLIRVDLASGQITGQTSLAAQAATDPLTTVGRVLAGWLAPTALAKLFLSPSLVLSADGSRLFMIGTDATDPLSSDVGSTGVWVVDPSSLTTMAHWAPKADYISLALNADGSLLLAAGMPGADAAGTSNNQDSSVTIYDASTGAIRAIAGQVQSNSAGWLLFPVPSP
jgi:hypothetical protein